MLTELRTKIYARSYASGRQLQIGVSIEDSIFGKAQCTEDLPKISFDKCIDAAFSDQNSNMEGAVHVLIVEVVLLDLNFTPS